MNIVGILSFVSVIILATVTFIFIYNTRNRIVEIKKNIKTDNLIMRDNITKVANDYHHNDQILLSKFDDYESIKALKDEIKNEIATVTNTVEDRLGTINRNIRELEFNVTNTNGKVLGLERMLENRGNEVVIKKPIKVLGDKINICDRSGNNCKDVITNYDAITLRAKKNGNRLQSGRGLNAKFANKNRLLSEILNIEKCGTPGISDRKTCG